jgi:hypothetical protein
MTLCRGAAADVATRLAYATPGMNMSKATTSMTAGFLLTWSST